MVDQPVGTRSGRAEPASSVRHWAKSPPPMGGERWALVVDDEPSIVDILASLLEDLGWSVLSAHCAAEACSQARAHHVALVLCDVCLPWTDGPTLVRLLRDERLIDGTPVVMMSANVRGGDQDGLTFLSKPFDLEDVARMVERIAPA